MAGANFAEVLRRVRIHEGGNDDDPRDPGGRTSRGITQTEWTAYVARHRAQQLPSDVWKAPDTAVDDIYRTRYWDALRCDELPAGVDYTVADYGINSGIGRSGKVLRRIVGLPDTTHVVTDEVLRAVAKRDPRAIIAAINDERLAFLKRLRTWPVFGTGWGRRVSEVRAVSLRLAGERAPAPAIVPSDAPVPGKGAIPVPAAAKKVIVGTGTAVPVAAGGNFWDWVAAHPWETAAIGVGVGVVVGGSIYALNRWYQRRQEAAIPDTPLVPELKAA